MNGCSMPDTCVSEPIGLDESKCYVPCTTPPADHTVCPGGFDMNGCPMPDTYIPTTGTVVCKKVQIISFLDLKCQFSGGQE